ncbi:endonuclease/exonuclease/phosphatase family protein [Alkalihalobacillus sp. AL-G]|uniref:endonuclease/exonuclease/phosphatase family protein n=1 Tax=Alkalihalobacillus sp. AL-G TaxID=2926399 RepID=UPI002729AB9B|nr:endonuclease/exonuclease/phosphatase family protein [Alkalihalobacillus sp. AL-G]WLD91600.1 endonuclease/exonuclease/phosphatase family protein [Alkalihalobacillus sp. AL-G]
MRELKIMTFNIHHGVGTDGRLDLDRIATVIIESNADIIGLNEVDRSFSQRSDYMDEIKYLAEKLKFEYSFSPSLTLKCRFSKNGGKYGNALLSKFPLVAKKPHQMDFISGIIEGRSLLQATIEPTYSLPIHFFVTHLSINPFLQRKQIEFILKHTTALKNTPVLVMGDFNLRSGQKNWRRLNSKLNDLGSGQPTYPSKRPRVQLDYLFGNNHVKAKNIQVFDYLPEASDHLPLLATIKF